MGARVIGNIGLKFPCEYRGGGAEKRRKGPSLSSCIRGVRSIVQ